MNTVPGSSISIRGGVRKEDGEVGSDLTGETEGAGKVRGMRERDGGRVAGISPDDAARKGEGRTVELGSLSHGRRTTNTSAGFTNQGRAKELPCGGMRRKVWDTDSDVDSFLQPACPGHRDNLGGGKPPTPKVLMMRHADPVAGTQRETPRHRDVQERGGTEETADGGDRA